MMNDNFGDVALVLFFLTFFVGATPLFAAERETDCKDGIDNDNDTVYDCADADCFSEPHCQPGQRRKGKQLG